MRSRLTLFFSFPTFQHHPRTTVATALVHWGTITSFPVSQHKKGRDAPLLKQSRHKSYFILIRFGSFVPTGQPWHLGGPDAHHADLQQPQPAGRRPLRQHHLRPGQWPRHGPHESRRSGRAPGPAAQSPSREEEDQSREHVGAAAGGALPHPGRPGLCHSRTQRGQNLQVGAHNDAHNLTSAKTKIHYL